MNVGTVWRETDSGRGIEVIQAYMNSMSVALTVAGNTPRRTNLILGSIFQKDINEIPRDRDLVGIHRVDRPNSISYGGPQLGDMGGGYLEGRDNEGRHR